MRLSHRLVAGLAGTAFLAACGQTITQPFGQLRSPTALAVHEPTGQLFIASLGADELRVYDAPNRAFLNAPAALFPLSIPTVRTPTSLAAAERFVFVLSGAEDALGFIDTAVPPEAAGPRSVDVGGFPLTLPLDMVASDLEAFTASWAWGPDGVLADHALVAGIDGSGESGLVLAVRPPVVDGTQILQLPLPEAVIELPGVFPSALAIDPTPAAVTGLRGPGGTPVVDCRPVAIGDGRYSPETGHEPGIWLTRVRVQPDGSLSLDTPAPEDRITIPVPVTLPDGSVEERLAPVRDLVFAPAPVTDAALAALAADPCAFRSGRLYAALDPSYCVGTVECADVAVIDLAGPDGPALAVDALEGGPALYDVPSTAMRVTAVSGPLRLPGAFSPTEFDEAGQALALDRLPALGLVAASNGLIYYLAGGLGPYLTGPGPDDRAPAQPVFPVDAEQGGPGLVGIVNRTDTGPRGELLLPSIGFPAEARPRDESWTAGFARPLPGLDAVGRLADVGDDGVVVAPAGVTFGGNVPVLADPSPARADRLVPRVFGEVVCEGFPVVEVAADGSALRVDLDPPLRNDPPCLDAITPLQVLPPLALPWWLEGSVTGFVGRVPGFVEGEPLPTSQVFAGDRLLFTFTPAEGTPVAGSAYGFNTTDGIQFYRSDPGDFAELPAAMVSWLRAGPRPGADPEWRVFVAYSGTDAVLSLNPTAPGVTTVLQ